MAAKKPPKKGEKPQKERFVEAAKAAGVDGDAFERAMGKIAPPKGQSAKSARRNKS